MRHRFNLPHAERRRLHRRAVRAQARGLWEVCGALLADRRSRLVLEFLKNHSDRPGHFEIQIADLRGVRAAAVRRGWRVLGTFHSHPLSDGRPGRSDRQLGWLGSYQLLYGLVGRDLRLWRITRVGGRRVAREVPFEHEARRRAGRISQLTARWSGRARQARKSDARAAQRGR